MGVEWVGEHVPHVHSLDIQAHSSVPEDEMLLCVLEGFLQWWRCRSSITCYTLRIHLRYEELTSTCIVCVLILIILLLYPDVCQD